MKGHPEELNGSFIMANGYGYGHGSIFFCWKVIYSDNYNVMHAWSIQHHVVCHAESQLPFQALSSL